MRGLTTRTIKGCVVVVWVATIAGCGGGGSSDPSQVATAGVAAPTSEVQSASSPGAQPVAAPRVAPARSPEDLLREEVRAWMDAPYRDNGTTKKGIGNAGFVRAVFQAAFATTIPSSYDEQMRTGKLVNRDALAAGDLVFFEGKGFGPFRSRAVGIYLGKDEAALARKEDGVVVVKLTEGRWNDLYKTARRMPSGEVAAPTFDVTKYGSNRAALLRDIAEAWSGTLYRAGGTTFQGIGNDEFVREVYGAIYETDLEGDPKTWATMGVAVSRDALEPGDIILYDAGGVGQIVSQRHAGIYLGNGEFVSALRGAAVTISKLDDPRWKTAFKAARRIDPDVLARAEEARATPRTPARGQGTGGGGRGAAAAAYRPPDAAPIPHVVTDQEQRLREVTESWRGTPYKLGGASRSGIDCSAFSRVLFEDVYKVELPRTAEEQERLGAGVERKALQPGDLVFFRTQGMGPLFRSRHVGVYLGGGEFAQASGRRGVTISSLDNRYWSRKFHSARRIAKAT